MNRFFDGLREAFRRTPVTADLILINAVLFGVTVATGGFTTDNLVRLGGLVPGFVTADGEWYRVFTAMFLHGSVPHFLMNMLALYFLGTAMERGIGPIRYLALYLVAGIGGDVAIVFLGEPYVLTIGASGALYGVMAALFYITLAKKNWFVPAAVRSIRRMIAINFVITFLFPNISILGHVAGFLAGLAAAAGLIPKNPYFARHRGPRPEPPRDPDDTDDDDPLPPS